MITGDPRATGIFEKDVQDTYAHLVERVRISKAEESAAGGEQIQLVPENPETSITFNVPDGPPPENLELEGPGFENVSIEDVRKALQMRWDMVSRRLIGRAAKSSPARRDTYAVLFLLPLGCRSK